MKNNLEVYTENYNLSFGQNHVLKDINLNIDKKIVTAIIGPSGCGKSTLLKSFNRMHDFIDSVKTTGKIFISGSDIFDPNINVYDLRTKVGMVFQKPNPFPKSIFENVVYGIKLKGIKNKSKLTEIAERSLKNSWLWDEVKDRLHESAYSLSGGQQQRLCIARALATNPEIILLDEPTSALDPMSTSKIEELIVELKKNVTILIVTHNIGQAGRISDKTAFMYLGELIEFDATEKMFTNPEQKLTEKYLSGNFG